METANHVLSFSHEQWSALAQSTPLPLTHSDIRRLSALGDPIDLAEADAVYRPLSALLQMYTAEVGRLHTRTSEFLRVREQRTPFVIAVAGSVAVGKSTTSRLLRELLRRWPATPKVDLVTTDGFLFPNSVLEERGIMDRKGFPESYDRAALMAFLQQIKAGAAQVSAPVYDHVTYDIIPGALQTVNHPDILIIEGLNVLQPARVTSTRELYAVSDFFDLSIYVDAPAEDIQRWYLERIFKLRKLAFTKPEAYFSKFAFMPDDELAAYAHNVWNTVNLPNLLDNIEPTRSRADIVLRKGSDHTISEVLLRKL
ncbi:MAG: type I pantothenate kinase [Ancrocorticia populi]|uniref:type I pantothenate kinase n=1 Tax=Ancrocorticia populi TaxID=2175228 RepID=UPI003F90952A